MSGVFSLINILADATGPGTVGLDGGSTYFFLCASLTTLAFILLHICWTIILFKSCDSGNKPFILFVLISHLAASYIVSNFSSFFVCFLVFTCLTEKCISVSAVDIFESFEAIRYIHSNAISATGDHIFGDA